MILQFNESEDADALDFFSATTKRQIGKVIRAKNYVGSIQLKNGTQIKHNYSHKERFYMRYDEF